MSRIYARGLLLPRNNWRSRSSSADMHGITLDRHADFLTWREKARHLCAAGVRPEDVRFNPPDRSRTLLDFTGEIPPAGQDRTVKASSAFLDIAERVVCHRDPERYDRLYRLLWRLQDQPSLMRQVIDPDVSWAMEADKSIRRDRHKMRAFVRFRKIGERPDGREQFMAWFEPDHYIVDLNSGFFQRRFPNMDWAIITPYRRVIWNGETLTYGSGGRREDVPDKDAVEDQWTTYFQSIFNPARVKIGAMTAEMPKKYWKNLPEAQVIPDLIRGAHSRERQFTATVNDAPNPLRDKALYQRSSVSTGIRAEDLTQLNQSLTSCQACPLWRDATQAVAGEGPRDARLMIIGEQPGDEEDRTGRPFIGPAGQLLDKALSEAGLDRQQAYVTNAVKHFKYMRKGQRRIHKNPSAAEIKACRPWLEREIKLVNPELIVCLGSSAARSVANKPVKISEQRGHIQRRTDGRDFLITTHPSYVLRTQSFDNNQDAFAAMVRDLQIAQTLLAA